MAGDPSAYTRIHGSQTDDDTSISPWICRPLLHSAPLLYNTRFPLSSSFFKIFIRHRPIFHFRLFSLVFSCFLTTHFTFLFYILCKTPFTAPFVTKNIAAPKRHGDRLFSHLLFYAHRVWQDRPQRFLCKDGRDPARFDTSSSQ